MRHGLLAFRRVAPVLAACALLAACGGGGEAQKDCTVRVQLFGDSTLWGWDGAATDGRRAVPTPGQVLQGLLDDTYGAGAVSVETRAVPGTATTQLLAGTDGLNRPWPQSVDADLVVVNFGINDQRLGMELEQYAANLARFGTTTARLVFQTPLPTTDRTGMAGDLFPQAMRDVAGRLGVAVADAAAYARGVPDWFTRFAPDGTHPNGAGYRAVTTSVLAPTIRAEIRRARLCGLT